MFDRDALSQALADFGRVVRVVIAGHTGSTPRETGTAMLIHAQGTVGTIGGGRLEYDAMARAQRLLADPAVAGGYADVLRQPLGPGLGQCCGGAVTVVTEVWDDAHFQDVIDGGDAPYPGFYARRVEGASDLPKGLDRRLSGRAGRTTPSGTQFADGWLIEPLSQDCRSVYIYGAGHVGHALATVLSALPQVQVALADVRRDLFDGLPDRVLRLDDRPPHEVMADAPAHAFHYIMTPEHDYDLELCHRVLQQPFAFAGLIGSKTKWAKFQKRLLGLGHGFDDIARITCPIGDPALGKHPYEIATGVARDLLLTGHSPAQRLEKQA